MKLLFLGNCDKLHLKTRVTVKRVTFLAKVTLTLSLFTGSVPITGHCHRRAQGYSSCGRGRKFVVAQLLHSQCVGADFALPPPPTLLMFMVIGVSECVRKKGGFQGIRAVVIFYCSIIHRSAASSVLVYIYCTKTHVTAQSGHHVVAAAAAVAEGLGREENRDGGS